MSTTNPVPPTPKPVDDGGPAFPIGSGDIRDPSGMSLRDWFAGQALKSILAEELRQMAAGDDVFQREANLDGTSDPRMQVYEERVFGGNPCHDTAPYCWAQAAYEMADNMLIARKSGGAA